MCFPAQLRNIFASALPSFSAPSLCAAPWAVAGAPPWLLGHQVAPGHLSVISRSEGALRSCLQTGIQDAQCENIFIPSFFLQNVLFSFCSQKKVGMVLDILLL